jgi:hypothetical protein
MIKGQAMFLSIYGDYYYYSSMKPPPPSSQGFDTGILLDIFRGAHPARAPPKIGKNMIFGGKIVIFHTKYPKIFRTSLRSAQFF